MGFSEVPPPPVVTPGADAPHITTKPPGPSSRTWLTRHKHRTAPMGPRPLPGSPPSGIVYSTAKGVNVIDVDGNRYVDLAAGFGSVLVGHGHPTVLRVLELQSTRLLQALGDVYPGEAKIALLEKLCALHPDPSAQGILAQSGSDAVAAALKTACLATGRPGVIAFKAAYHGLGYGPLAVTDLRAGYRAPFAEQLNPHVEHVEYPTAGNAEQVLERVTSLLAQGGVGAVLIEPILGRGGVRVLPPGLLAELAARARKFGALLIADEIWTGLGRAGKLFTSVQGCVVPDLLCLGKGLGGGLPISACLGSRELMGAWSREEECVHTSTFAGSPLACATAIATLDILAREHLVERSAQVGARWKDSLRAALPSFVSDVRGQGLMIGVDFDQSPGIASTVQRRLLEVGYITSTGGGAREVLVLTPPLTTPEPLLEGFTAALTTIVKSLSSA